MQNLSLKQKNIVYGKTGINIDQLKVSIELPIDFMKKFADQIWSVMAKYSKNELLGKSLEQAIKDKYDEYVNWLNYEASEESLDELSVCDDHWEIKVFPIKFCGQVEDITSIEILFYFFDEEERTLENRIQYIISNIGQPNYNDYLEMTKFKSLYCYQCHDSLHTYDSNNYCVELGYQLSDTIFYLSGLTLNDKLDDDSKKIEIFTKLGYDDEKYFRDINKDNIIVIKKMISQRNENFSEIYSLALINQDGEIMERNTTPIDYNDNKFRYEVPSDDELRIEYEEASISKYTDEQLKTFCDNEQLSFLIPYMNLAPKYEFDSNVEDYVISLCKKLGIWDKMKVFDDQYTDYYTNKVCTQKLFVYNDNNYEFCGYCKENNLILTDFKGTIDNIEYKYSSCKLYINFEDDEKNLIKINFYQWMAVREMKIVFNEKFLIKINKYDDRYDISIRNDENITDLIITKDGHIYTSWEEWNNSKKI